jgi:chromosome segregation ATPase
MHSAHRDLETKFKRTRQDLEQALKDKSDLQAQNNKRIEEITVLKTKNTDQESKITSQKERIDSLMRDLQIKSDQLKEFEDRNARTMDDLDLCKYKL